MGHEVDDKDVVNKWSDEIAKSFVFRMFQVTVAFFFGLERKDEAVGKPLVALLFTDICSPFQRFDPRNFVLERGEGFLDFFNILSRGGAFELETDHVVNFRGGTCRANHAKGQKRQKK